MKRLFYISVWLLVLFEIANVYFIMPMPFSQRMRSIDLAYGIYSARWIVRAVLGATAIATALAAWRGTRSYWRIVPVTTALGGAFILYAANFQMSADRIFL